MTVECARGYRERSAEGNELKPHAWRRDLIAVVVLLIALNLAAALVLDGWVSALVQISATVVAVVGARHRGYSSAELGLARSDVAAGLRLGGLLSAGVAAAVAIVAIVPMTSGYFDDDRFVDLTAAEAAWEIGFRIPVVTALTEELLFRSVLLAVLLAAMSTWRAAMASSALFGAWHILTTAGDLGGNEASADFAGWEVVASVVGVVAVTAAAGVVFAWLRLRSGSVVAPWLVHTVLNASTFTAGAIAAA